MKSIAIVGDVHGKFDEYYQQIKKSGARESIQIGDMGVGFGKTSDEILMTYLDHLNDQDANSYHRFFRGNHDSPDVCNGHPYHLGDWGYLSDYGIFWIAGAWSIDWEWRKEGIEWWSDEQLSDDVWKEIREAYSDIKPNIVLSHDAPLDAYSQVLGYHGSRIIPTTTSRELNGLFFIHQPKRWTFGHHHTGITQNYLGCEFRCLAELEIYELRIEDD